MSISEILCEKEERRGREKGEKRKRKGREKAEKRERKGRENVEKEENGEKGENGEKEEKEEKEEERMRKGGGKEECLPCFCSVSCAQGMTFCSTPKGCATP